MTYLEKLQDRAILALHKTQWRPKNIALVLGIKTAYVIKVMTPDPGFGGLSCRARNCLSRLGVTNRTELVMKLLIEPRRFM